MDRTETKGRLLDYFRHGPRKESILTPVPRKTHPLEIRLWSHYLSSVILILTPVKFRKIRPPYRPVSTTPPTLETFNLPVHQPCSPLYLFLLQYTTVWFNSLNRKEGPRHPSVTSQNSPSVTEVTRKISLVRLQR